MAKKVGTGSWTVYNIFRDHLGTITHLKNADTGAVDEYSFEAWGRRRDKDDWSYTLSGEPALFAGRGFTAHEHLEDFNLINMNGRLYDPVVGRFLSPYPFILGVDFTQGFNRYSYALNNPLVYTDPNGEFPWLFAIGFVVGGYLGGTAINDWQWNPGKWDYSNPATFFGIFAGGLAGGLGGSWLFGPEDVLAGGTSVNVSLGATFDNIGTAFANFSFGEGAGVAFEGLGYITALGGGAYITGSAINNWLNGNNNEISISSNVTMPSSKFRPGDLGSSDYLTEIQYTLSYAERFGTGKLTQELFNFENALTNFELTFAQGQPNFWQNRNYKNLGIRIVLYEDISYGGLRFYSHGRGKDFLMSNFNLKLENFPSINIY